MSARPWSCVARAAPRGSGNLSRPGPATSSSRGLPDDGGASSGALICNHQGCRFPWLSSHQHRGPGSVPLWTSCASPPHTSTDCCVCDGVATSPVVATLLLQASSSSASPQQTAARESADRSRANPPLPIYADPRFCTPPSEPRVRRRAELRPQPGGDSPGRQRTHPTARRDPVRRQARDGKLPSPLGRRDGPFCRSSGPRGRWLLLRSEAARADISPGNPVSGLAAI
jgi:hypothetical protein